MLPMSTDLVEMGDCDAVLSWERGCTEAHHYRMGMS